MKIIRDFWIRLNGIMVGTDKYGNQYYITKHTSKCLNIGSRMVIFKSKNEEPSSIPCEWYHWLHHMSDQLPSKSYFIKHNWQVDRIPNMTGTELAYHPTNTEVKNYYESWTPISKKKQCNTVTSKL